MCFDRQFISSSRIECLAECAGITRVGLAVTLAQAFNCFIAGLPRGDTLEYHLEPAKDVSSETQLYIFTLS